MGVRSVLLPDVGEGVAEAEIVEWCVKVGDEVAADQVLAAVMTDKANVEIPSPVAGKVLRLGGAVGETLATGSELVRIDAPGMADLPSPSLRPKNEEAPVAPPAKIEAEKRPPKQQKSPVRKPGDRPLASPAVRLRAREAGVDLRLVAGAGPAGRITHEDLTQFIDAPVAPVRGRAPNLSTEAIPVIGMRRRISQRMAEATRRIAHFSYVEEVDVTVLEELRAQLNGQAPEARPKLTLLPFLMLALVRALPRFPQMNAHYDDEQDVVTRYGAAHIGVATQTAAGLTVPVVRHAEALTLYGAAAEMRRVTEAARQGTAMAKDMSGSTITITSLGALGGLATTPVINRPETAIIGVNKIAVRPVWRDNGFVPRKMMNLSSSFDHRVVDGWDAATFIQSLRALLEAPATIFIDA